MSYIPKRGSNPEIRRMISRQQVSDVFSYGYVVTTKSRGKATQKEVEKLITLAKKGRLIDIRRIEAYILRTKKYEKIELLRKIMGEIANKYQNRDGGCTRLLKMEKEDTVIVSLV